MIIIKGRELLVPNYERYIGTTFDTAAENRQFQLARFSQGGEDLSALTFRLDLEFPNGSKNTVLLGKEVTDDYIVLTWTITGPQLQQIGTLFIQIRASDENNTVRWSSFKTAMYTEDHIYTPGSRTDDLTELEQLENQFAAFASAEERRAANEAGRVAVEAARVEAEVDREEAFENAIDDFNDQRQDLLDDWNTKMADGYFIGPKGDKGEKGDPGDRGLTGLQGPQGRQGIQGERGESGIVVPVQGTYSLYVDASGYLHVLYDEGTAVPTFYIDQDGYLHVVQGE